MRSGELGESFGRVCELHLVLLCKHSAYRALVAPLLPLPLHQSAVSLCTAAMGSHCHICRKYTHRPCGRTAALNCLLVFRKKGWSQAVGCKEQDPERSNGVLWKDGDVTAWRERVTKCLPKSLVAAHGDTYKQICIAHKHLHYKSS